MLHLLLSVLAVLVAISMVPTILSENFDVSTASYVDTLDVSGAETHPADLAFDYSGKYMFILGFTGKDVTVYKLSEPFDVSTAVVQSG